MKKKVFAIATSLLIIFILTACDGKISNKALQKMLKDDSDFTNIDFSSAKTIAETELDKDTKILLFSAKETDNTKLTYYTAVADTKKDILSPIKILYEPLEFLQKEISSNRPQSMNMDYFTKLTEHLAKDINFFDNEENNIEFLRNVTGVDGIISTDTAQSAITTIAKEVFSQDETEDFLIIFEEDNANPIQYAVKAVDSVYSWDWLPEAQYLTFVSSSNKEELEKAEEEHGPAYNDENVWIAYDLNKEKTGVYKTKSELYKAVTGNISVADEEPDKPEGTLKLATVTDKPPFAYINGGIPVGADIDIARAIAEELNMELEISTMSSSAAINGTSKGTYHMAMAAYTASVENNSIRFTDNYYGNYVILLGKNGGKLNDKICSALASIKADGKIEKIINAHNADKAPKPAEEKIEHPKEEKPSNESVQESTPTTISYRVRKSADDSKSQIGAFSSLENAKKEAETHKNEGYKVYDMSGKLVYTP